MSSVALAWKNVCMGLEKLFEKFGKIVNYFGGDFYSLDDIVKASFRMSFKLHQNPFLYLLM